jgi:hypothetical protein
MLGRGEAQFIRAPQAATAPMRMPGLAFWDELAQGQLESNFRIMDWPIEVAAAVLGVALACQCTSNSARVLAWL